MPNFPFPVKHLNYKDIYFGGYGGVNFSFPGIRSSYAVIDQSGSTLPGGKTYSGLFRNIGFQMGAISYLKVNNHIAVAVLPGIAGYSFFYNYMNRWNDINTVYTDNYSFNIRYWTLSLPIQGYYILNPDNKVNFYGILGLKYEFIFNAVKTVGLTENLAVNNIEKGSYTNAFKSRSDRMFIRSDFQSIAGIGISYQFTHFVVMTEFDYVKGWNDITKFNNRYNDPQNLYTYPDIQDNLVTNNLALNIIILYKLFEAPKKLKCVTP